ncbi:MAG: GacS/BarA family sensor protein [Francisellaceae bacterium]|nr:GacS/BarA family sensor protein [Francisellaceae bacterium]
MGQKAQILLVEDLKIAQKVAILTLEDLNCEVDVAETGLEALEKIKIKSYQLIFMDIGLPDIDGLTITETIRRQESIYTTQKFTPIIALTAHSNDEELKRQCLEVGINDYIIKPLKPENAQVILNKYL